MREPDFETSHKIETYKGLIQLGTFGLKFVESTGIRYGLLLLVRRTATGSSICPQRTVKDRV
jgi:hypothetical protein